MTPKLNDELREALRQTDGPIEVRDEQSQKLYVISESDMFLRAMQALDAQENHAAIQDGISAMEAGNVVSLDELDQRIGSRLEIR